MVTKIASDYQPITDKEKTPVETIRDTIFDAERALYGRKDLCVEHCRFDGPADGESAFKEVRDCFFNLRYPFWHVTGLRLQDCEMTELCRAALWYTRDADIRACRLHGIKALRECDDIRMQDCDIVSPEFGWSTCGLDMRDTAAESEYFMLRAEDLHFTRVRLKGKYSFQYIQNAVFEDCDFDTKDAFWHAKNVTVKNSTIRGEYLAWYCENVTFENCRIIGTQPLCYCKGLRLVDCEMLQADLCFEKSEVEATLTAPVVSIKNPAAGCIRLPALGELVMDDPAAAGKVCVGDPCACA